MNHITAALMVPFIVEYIHIHAVKIFVKNYVTHLMFFSLGLLSRSAPEFKALQLSAAPWMHLIGSTTPVI